MAAGFFADIGLFTCSRNRPPDLLLADMMAADHIATRINCALGSQKNVLPSGTDREPLKNVYDEELPGKFYLKADCAGMPVYTW